MPQFLASWFGCGYLPKMPGTWGTLGAIPLVLALQWLSLACSVRLDIILIIGATLTFLGGWLACSKILKHIKNETLESLTTKNLHDPSWIVIDEVSGLLLTCSIVFWGQSFDAFFGEIRFAILLLSSFILFRIYDILKPWPIKFIESCLSSHEKLQPFAIMFDDTVAALMAALTLRLVFHTY